MPIRQGYETATRPSGTYAAAYISGHVVSDSSNVWPPSLSGAVDLYGQWPSTHTLRRQRPGAVARSGYKAKSYFDDFYNRIHVTPRLIDFGNITPPQTRTVDVWNAFLTAQTLQAIVGTGSTDGLSWSPAAPLVFQGLQERTLTLTAGSDVSPIVEATYTLQWIGLPEITIDVTGVATIAVPWRQADTLQETLAWLTDILTAKDGSEQAISLRETPRQRYDITLLPGDYSAAQHAFVDGYGRTFAVPSIDEGQPFFALAGATAIAIDTTQGDWREMAMLWVDENDFEIIEIDQAATTPTSLALKKPTAATRRGMAFPTAAARLAADPVRTTSAMQGRTRITASFEFLGGVDLAGAASLVQWHGIDVLLQEPRLRSVDDTLQQRIDTLDNGTGWPQDNRYWPRAKIKRPMRWVLERSEMWALRGWLHRRRGQWQPFYHPSFEADFIPAGTGTINSALIVKANDFLRHPRDVALAILTFSGDWVFADVTGVSDVGGGSGNMALQLAQTLATTHAQCRRISLMGLKRFATDTAQIRHLGNGRREVLADFLEYAP